MYSISDSQLRMLKSGECGPDADFSIALGAALPAHDHSWHGKRKNINLETVHRLTKPVSQVIIISFLAFVPDRVLRWR